MAAKYNPFAALSPKQISAQARRLVGAQYNPVVAQLRAQEASGQQAIQGYTNQLASQLAPLAGRTAQNYQNATAQQNAIDTALANRLQGAGAAGGAQLAAQFQQAGLQGAPNTAAQTGTGAANAGYAMGSAAMSALLSQGAAAQQYSAVLPGIARLGGLQQSQLLHGQTQQNVAQTLAKEPGSYQQAVSDLQNQELQKAVAVQSGLVNQQKLQQSGAIASAKLQQGNARLGLQARSLQLRQQEQATNNLFKQAGLNISKARLRIAAANEVRLQNSKGGKKGGFTPTQISKYKANAYASVKAHKAEWEAAVQAGTTKNSRQTSAKNIFNWLVNNGYPPSIADYEVGLRYGKWKTAGDNKALGIK